MTHDIRTFRALVINLSFVALLMCPQIGSAKSIATYLMVVQPVGAKDTSAEGTWLCTSKQVVHGLVPLREDEHRYKQGSFVQYPVSSPLARLQTPIIQTFTRDLEQPALLQQIHLEESCEISRQVTELTTTTDSDGNVQTSVRTRTKREHRNFMWECPGIRLPEKKGVPSRAVSCESVGDDRTSRTFKASISVTEVKEVYAKSIGCKGQDENRVIVGLRECAGSNVGVVGSKFSITIDDQPAFEIKASSDPLLEEVEYCGAGADRVRLQIMPTDRITLAEKTAEVPIFEFARAAGEIEKAERNVDDLRRIAVRGESPISEDACLTVSVREAPLKKSRAPANVPCPENQAAKGDKLPLSGTATSNVKATVEVLDKEYSKNPAKRRSKR